MKSINYSIKQRVAKIATLCLITDYSFGQVNCQNGLDYKNSCNPYKVKFIKVPTTSKSTKDATRISKSTNHYRTQSYLDTLLNRYSSNYNGEYGLQAVIDRSGYKSLESKKEDNSSKVKKDNSLSSLKNTKIVKEESKIKSVASSKTTTTKKVTDTTLASSKLTKVIKKEHNVAKGTTKSKSKSTSVSSKKVATITTKKLKTTKVAFKNIKKEDKITKSIKKTAVKISKKENTKVLHKKTSTKIAKKVVTIKNKSKSKENYKFYTIKKGDSLIKISKKFKISAKQIKKINSFDKNNTLKVGYKIKLPSSVDLKAIKKLAKKTKKNNLYYVVKKGDTLSLIAKSTKVSITKLREINRLSRSSSIRVGEKIYLKPTKLVKRKNRSFNFAKNIKFKKTPSLKHKRKIRVVATAYTSHRNQTDNTPFLAAWNNRIRPGMRIIAVSPDLIRKYGLTNGVRVKIMGLPGFYTVRDKMNKRLRNHIDIYMGVNKRRALRWGRRRIVLYW